MFVFLFFNTQLSVESYMSLVESCQPAIFEVLSDGDTPEGSTTKRIRKSVDRSLEFLDQCLEICKSNEVWFCLVSLIKILLYRIESSGLYNHFDMESLVGIEEIWEYVQYVGMRNMCRWFLKIFVSWIPHILQSVHGVALIVFMCTME